MSLRWSALLAAPSIAAPMIAAAAAADQARASPLAVSAPEQCPGASALEHAVAAHVGRAVPLDGVSVSIGRSPTAWRARLQTASGERELEAESCAAAIEAVALVLALAVEPEVQASLGASSSSPGEVPAPSVAESASLQPARTIADEPAVAANNAVPDVPASAPHALDDDVALALGAGLLAEVGLLPAPSVGPRLAIGVAMPAWRVELAGLVLLPRRAELGVDGALAADIGSWSAQLTGG